MGLRGKGFNPFADSAVGREGMQEQEKLWGESAALAVMGVLYRVIESTKLEKTFEINSRCRVHH